VAECAALKGSAHSEIYRSGIFCCLKRKGVAAQNRVVVRVAVVALAEIVLGILGAVAGLNA
jgi:hypothetical protein